jgi:ABC-type Fe3+ transport system permease subunit
MVHVLLPMMVLPLYGATRRIDPALVRADQGLNDGAGAIFATVFLPLSLSGQAAGCALVFLSALGFYITPALLGAPGDYLLAQAIEVRVSTLAEFDVAAALSCLLLAVVTGLLLLLRRQVVTMEVGTPRRAPHGGSPGGLRPGHGLPAALGGLGRGWPMLWRPWPGRCMPWACSSSCWRQWSWWCSSASAARLT